MRQPGDDFKYHSNKRACVCFCLWEREKGKKEWKKECDDTWIELLGLLLGRTNRLGHEKSNERDTKCDVWVWLMRYKGVHIENHFLYAHVYHYCRWSLDGYWFYYYYYYFLTSLWDLSAVCILPLQLLSPTFSPPRKRLDLSLKFRAQNWKRSTISSIPTPTINGWSCFIISMLMDVNENFIMRSCLLITMVAVSLRPRLKRFQLILRYVTEQS